jgi:hypothetical protein
MNSLKSQHPARFRVAWLGFTTTYKTAGTAKLRGSHIRRRFCGLGCGLEKSTNSETTPHFIFQNLFMDNFRVVTHPLSIEAGTSRVRF